MSRSQSGAQFLDLDEFRSARESAMRLRIPMRTISTALLIIAPDEAWHEPTRRALSMGKHFRDSDILPPALALPAAPILGDSPQFA